MRAVIQRVARASVTVDEAVVGRIDAGLLAYLGVGAHDDEADLDYMARKIRYLRIFQDDAGRMNRDVVEAGGAVLVVSNFTLYADVRKGRRPAFADAAAPERALELYEQFCTRLQALGPKVERGRFRAAMAVEALNVGPVNILVDSRQRR